ncbi:response regulator transcription factor [Paenibacillus yanchengensis]|uniref:Response regulator transcription factor n=1 Tax=Paenibacillus yanchengensis TaxID=2035833 RepID=A0ABW4YPX2_9BACL
MYRIFIIEDDFKIAEILKQKLKKYGYIVERAEQFQQLQIESKQFDPHVILLDINLPYYDGYYWCRQIRITSSVPIIFLSARAGEMDQVMALENGGDDYVTKPIQIDLLLAKIKSLLRRTYGEYAGDINQVRGDSNEESEHQTAGVINVGELQLFFSRNVLRWHQQQIELTKNEVKLAHCFLQAYGNVVTRETLLEALWDDVSFVDDNTLTVNVTRLRKKMEQIGLPKAIETVRGSGYKLVLPAL